MHFCLKMEKNQQRQFGQGASNLSQQKAYIYFMGRYSPAVEIIRTISNRFGSEMYTQMCRQLTI